MHTAFTLNLEQQKYIPKYINFKKTVNHSDYLNSDFLEDIRGRRRTDLLFLHVQYNKRIFLKFFKKKIKCSLTLIIQTKH